MRSRIWRRKFWLPMRSSGHCKHPHDGGKKNNFLKLQRSTKRAILKEHEGDDQYAQARGSNNLGAKDRWRGGRHGLP